MAIQGPNELRAATLPPADNGVSGRASQTAVPRTYERAEAPQTPPPVERFSKATAEQLDQATQQLKDTAAAFNKRLDFRVDENTGRTVVRVVDTETNEVIRELPPEKVLELAARIKVELGNLIDELA